MASKIYKLSTQTIASGSAAATVTITQSGYITGATWGGYVTAGAAATGVFGYELALNSSTSTISTNDTPGSSLDTAIISCNVASVPQSVNKDSVGMSVPVRAGDKLYLHCYQYGQAGAVGLINCHVAVSS